MNPSRPDDAPADLPNPSWFVYHDFQRKDMVRGAQNAADTTRCNQDIYHRNADGEWELWQVVNPQEGRMYAGLPFSQFLWEA